MHIQTDSSSSSGTISAIIVNWNGKHLLTECLDSLRAQIRLADEILVVDNGSSDGSQALVREGYPEVTLIELPDNKGFSVANNIAMRRATGNYIALLNNDLLLDPRWMAAMVATLESDRLLGACACKMLLYDRRDTIDAAGINVARNGGGSNRFHLKPDSETLQRPIHVFGACAGAALYQSSMLRDIGLFDEDLHIYYEDVDLAFRAQLAGYQCLYVPEAVAYHHHSASSGDTARKYYYLARNNMLVIAKNMPTMLLLRYLPRIIIRQLELGLVMGKRGHLGAYGLACRDALRLLPRMVAKRRQIQVGARRSAKEIAALLA